MSEEYTLGEQKRVQGQSQQLHIKRNLKLTGEISAIMTHHGIINVIIINGKICSNTLPLLGKRLTKHWRSELLGKSKRSQNIETKGDAEWKELEERNIRH